MKKLLATITISALVGISAGNLKPLFTNSVVVSHGFKSNKINNKDIRITNENDTNPFISKIIDIDTNERVTCSIIAHNGIIYVGTAYGKGSYQLVNYIKVLEIGSN